MDIKYNGMKVEIIFKKISKTVVKVFFIYIGIVEMERITLLLQNQERDLLHIIVQKVITTHYIEQSCLNMKSV